MGETSRFDFSRFTSVLSGAAGLAAMALPLYLYPLVTFDPLQDKSLFSQSAYGSLFVPYALVFFVASVGVFARSKLASFSLFIIFVTSHLHFKWRFGDMIVLKPGFVAVFIMVPAAIMLLGLIGNFMSPSRQNASSQLKS